MLAGAAGLVMGNSILFPGTYPRMESFRRGARRGLKMVIGLVPIFITAGFLGILRDPADRVAGVHQIIYLSVYQPSSLFIYFVVLPY